MKYHLKLKKALSYCGIVTATKKQPDVFVEDEETANQILNTGYFELVEKKEEKQQENTNTSPITKEQIEKMKIEDLKSIAEEKGIDITTLSKKADYIEAITAFDNNNNEVDYQEFQ